MLKGVIALLVLLSATSAAADVTDAGITDASITEAVVIIEGCSGVCVDPAGLVLTVKHCQLPARVTVRFPGRSVAATRVWSSGASEGPLVYDCDGDGYPWRPVATAPPRLGARLSSYGYPDIQGRRELRSAFGPLLRSGTFTYAGGTFRGNVVGFGACPGWSGGPLLTARGEVCGLLNSSEGVTSVFVSSAAVREALAAAREELARRPPDDGRPPLLVFGAEGCARCRQFQDDYARNQRLRDALEHAYAVEFIDIDRQPALAQRHGVREVPTFVADDGPRITGYSGPEGLLHELGLTLAPDIVAPTPDVEPALERESRTAEDTPSPTADRLDRVAALIETGLRVTTWLGIGGLTGGTGGLVLGGLALWRTLGRRRSRPARDPPVAEAVEKPAAMTAAAPAIVPETRFAPYERDTFAEAFGWAETELVRKYPGAVGTLESLRGLIDQYLAAQGVTRAAAPSSSTR